MTTTEKKQLMILGICVVALILIWLYRQKPRQGIAGNRGLTGRVVFVNDPEAIARKGARTSRADIAYTGRGARDPMDNASVLEKKAEKIEEKKEEPKAAPVGSFSVSAVVWGARRPQAIINNKVVNIGEQIDGGRIIGIDKNGVRMDFDGEEVLLPVK